MRQTKLILIAILSGVFLLLGAVLVLEITGHGLFWGNRGFSVSIEEENDPKTYTKVLEYETEASQIKELNLLFDKNSNEIFFYESDSEKIVIQEYVNWKPSERETTTVEEQNGILTVTGRRRNTGLIFLGFNSRHGYVKVYLPASYQGSLKVSALSGDISADVDLILGEKAKFKASTTSGDVDLLKVQAEKADISSVSGELTVQEITGDTSFSTTSGDITVKKVTGDMKFSTTSGEIEVLQGQGSCKAGTVSGDVQLSALQGSFDISTTSGAVEVYGNIGGGEVSTVSGDIRLAFDALQTDLDISSTSGEVQIYLPEDTSIDFDASTTSGGISTFFDPSLSFNKKGNKASGVYGSGTPLRVEVDTTSGDVTVRAQ